MPVNQDIFEQIRVTANQLGIDDFVIEKDYHVTQAIAVCQPSLS